MSDVDRRRVLVTGISAAVGGGAPKQESVGSNSRLYTFVAGGSGDWSVTGARAIAGEPLPAAQRLDIVKGTLTHLPAGANWALRGVASNTRYTTRGEKEALAARQATLGRADATRAAFIPIRKNAAWWELAQDERRRIFEESSHHTKKGLNYLPAIARRLHHCRDLDTAEPFDFLTWFDYAPQNANAFDDLLGELRATEEWKFVEREVDIRLAR